MVSRQWSYQIRIIAHTYDIQTTSFSPCSPAPEAPLLPSPGSMVIQPDLISVVSLLYSKAIPKVACP
ncbi:MAG: hypothetical protein F6J98_41985 [Moorea sp. SIO4G2]|uniref:hypothetical protein n=1 Tax=Moorena sp. SIO3I6 TaxID=2607831 RepID=UPI0013F7C0CB|nr:hypothetical protein [Moorena sp. SIO3I6]NEO66597.1 hypothetical protein [Moorena sp. SIO4G2]NEP24882.1 hypothetical protein [Moorena sp. SIO3I6]